MHLDLSYNNFTIEESKFIQASLNNNHSIFGFHFEGNYGYIDNKGFLKIPDNFIKETISPLDPLFRIKG